MATIKQMVTPNGQSVKLAYGDFYYGDGNDPILDASSNEPYGELHKDCVVAIKDSGEWYSLHDTEKSALDFVDEWSGIFANE